MRGSAKWSVIEYNILRDHSCAQDYTTDAVGAEFLIKGCRVIQGAGIIGVRMVDMLSDEVDDAQPRESTTGCSRIMASAASAICAGTACPTEFCEMAGASDRKCYGITRGVKDEEGAKLGNDKMTVVGYAFMPKKNDSMSKVMGTGPSDAVEFLPIDFSIPPEEHDDKHGRGMDVILHKLSDDIMIRNNQTKGSGRLEWIEQYLKCHPETVVVDAFDSVGKVIDRRITLELLTESYRKQGASGGMPRPPRYLVLDTETEATRGESEAIRGRRWAGSVPEDDSRVDFPVICKPIDACGSRESHTMTVVLNEAGMRDVPKPTVVQEYCNHGALLFKVCVIGNDVRVYTRSSLPDLPLGLQGSFKFDSQRPYPSLNEMIASCRGKRKSGDASDGSSAASRCSTGNGTVSRAKLQSPLQPTITASEVDCVHNYTPDLSPFAAEVIESARCCSDGAVVLSSPDTVASSHCSGRAHGCEHAKCAHDSCHPPAGMIRCDGVTSQGLQHAKATPVSLEARGPTIPLDVARSAAGRMRETFGLSIFGFDLIVDSASGETVVIDVNFFPSFKDLHDFPQVLRRRLKEVAAESKCAGRRTRHTDGI